MRNRGQKLTEKQKNDLHRIKRKYHTSKTSKLKEIKEKLYQRVKVQMKCFFLLLNLKEQLKSGRSPLTIS